jgi:hypothetical protein
MFIVKTDKGITNVYSEDRQRNIQCLLWRQTKVYPMIIVKKDKGISNVYSYPIFKVKREKGKPNVYGEDKVISNIYNRRHKHLLLRILFNDHFSYYLLW